MEIGFEGRTVVVTGAVRGIGQGIAHAFAALGATVHAWDILADGLQETRRTASPERGGTIHPHVVDVTDFDAVKAAVEAAEAESASGAVDVAVHVAGGVKGQSKRPIEEVTLEDWRAIQAVNLDGAFHLAKAVAPGMKQAGTGRIVVISSGAAFNVSLTGIHSYGTAKSAQIGFVRQLSAELGPFGITVNSVAPGFMPTSPDYVRQWESYGEEGQTAMVKRIPMGRIGTPRDVANAVLFFASDHAEWVTGQTLRVSGGM
ncbi:SDR family NAD(P)-dependent oxidoreductase [Thalassobaculum salexigens]|uniref:SDR family NAD(P)-dependent oxidoreductase n=1 Tax=Thalassobaculum salexigens TaxID=455360 RepID=UPI00248DF90C|nr:SDR family NAD(P)-dependent oxidoreductase [Thalassobaculum salexigens]